jgi:GTP-binding protein EngB required for normal cell division
MPKHAEGIPGATDVPHLIVVGEMGAGKSTLLNAVYGGKKAASGALHFNMSDRANSCTQKPQTECEEILHPSGPLKLRLTDVPGFADRSKKNDETMNALIKHLRANSAIFAHGMVVAHDYNQPRLSEATVQSIKSLDNVFGDRFWDYLHVVFTKFDLPRGVDEDSVERKADELKTTKCADWKKALFAVFPQAARKWGDGYNMFFFVNSKALLTSDEEIARMKTVTTGSAAGEGAHYEVMKRFSQKEVDQLLKTVKERKDMGVGLNFVSGNAATMSPGEAQQTQDIRKMAPPAETIQAAVHAAAKTELLMQRAERT